MKLSTFISLSIIISGILSEVNAQYVVTGRFPEKKNLKVNIRYYSPDVGMSTFNTVDSTFTDDQGQFNFTPPINEPVLVNAKLTSL